MRERQSNPSMTSTDSGTASTAKLVQRFWPRFTTFVDELDSIRKLALIFAAVLGLVPITLTSYLAVKALTAAPTPTPAPSPSAIAQGVPNVYLMESGQAVAQLTSVGYVARTIPVCSDSITVPGRVRQVLTDVGRGEGTVLVDAPGVTTAGRILATGTKIVAKVTDGSRC